VQHDDFMIFISKTAQNFDTKVNNIIEYVIYIFLYQYIVRLLE